LQEGAEKSGSLKFHIVGNSQKSVARTSESMKIEQILDFVNFNPEETATGNEE